MKVLVTGIAGFIGFHVSKRLLDMGYEVLGFDNLNDYYDVNLKFARLHELGLDRHKIRLAEKTRSVKYGGLTFIKLSLEDRVGVETLFQKEKFDYVCHLAAQAGVRYSLENPHGYIESNIVGFLNILEGCRHNSIKHLVFASSSSVYGLNSKMPLSVTSSVDHPVSLYAVTKKSNELMAHSYSHLFSLPTTGLRFFTVYGPWGRPDMSPILFASAITKGESIKVFNHGKMLRDFTYIDDIVDGVVNVLFSPACAQDNWDTFNPNPASSIAPYRIYNIGNSRPVELMSFIEKIEFALGKKAVKDMLPMQDGDVLKTFADISEMKRDFNYSPKTSLEQGVANFVNWFRDYYTV